MKRLNVRNILLLAKDNDISNVQDEKLNSNEAEVYKLKESLKPQIKLLDNLKDEINKLNESFLNVSKILGNISNLTNQIQKHQLSGSYFYEEYDMKYYSKMTEIFKQWSDSYSKQINNFKNDIRNPITCIRKEYEAYVLMIDDYKSNKKTYLSMSESLLEKKEKLFKVGNIEKWDLETEDILNKESLLNNKQEAFSKMLRNETRKVNDMEIKVKYLNTQLVKEYNKLRKFISNLLKSTNEEMISKNKELIGDIFSMIKLVTLNI